jgi:hypothetical protein
MRSHRTQGQARSPLLSHILYPLLDQPTPQRSGLRGWSFAPASSLVRGVFIRVRAHAKNLRLSRPSTKGNSNDLA